MRISCTCSSFLLFVTRSTISGATNCSNRELLPWSSRWDFSSILFSSCRSTNDPGTTMVTGWSLRRLPTFSYNTYFGPCFFLLSNYKTWMLRGGGIYGPLGYFSLSMSSILSDSISWLSDLSSKFMLLYLTVNCEVYLSFFILVFRSSIGVVFKFLWERWTCCFALALLGLSSCPSSLRFFMLNFRYAEQYLATSHSSRSDMFFLYFL